MLQTIQRWLWPLLTGLALLLAVLLLLSPTELTLGQTVKLVYLHGALVRTAIVLFAVSLPLNLIAVFNHKPDWFSWGQACSWAAVAIWLGHTLFSMVTTYAAWGVFIAWFEPRTRFTFILAAVTLIVTTVAWLVADARFSAVAFALLAGLTLGLLPRLGFIQHPLDPIGTSPSPTIRIFYAAILVISVAMGGLLTVWLQARLSLAWGDNQSEVTQS
jgi:hypothetical protein